MKAPGDISESVAPPNPVGFDAVSYFGAVFARALRGGSAMRKHVQGPAGDNSRTTEVVPGAEA